LIHRARTGACADEKSQIQLWIGPSRPPDKEGRANHDARLQRNDDHAICRDRTAQWHRESANVAEASPPEWIKFLRAIDEQTPATSPLHLIAITTDTNTQSAGVAKRHPDFHIPPPTSASWLNLIERFFRDLTSAKIRRGTFLNVEP